MPLGTLGGLDGSRDCRAIVRVRVRCGRRGLHGRSRATPCPRSPRVTGCARPTCWRSTGWTGRRSSTPARCWCLAAVAADCRPRLPPAPVALPRPARVRTRFRAATRSARSRSVTASRSTTSSPRTASTGRRSSTPVRPSPSPGASRPRPSRPVDAGRGCGARRAAAPAPVRADAPARMSSSGGDTISGIAKNHGVSTQAVLDANGLSRSSIIYPGQTIAIPAAASVALLPRRSRSPRRDRARRRADRERAAHHQRRPRTRRARPRHRDRARHGDAGVVAAQPRLGRPRLAGPVPAAPERRLGHGGGGQRSRARRARVLRRTRPTRTGTPPAGSWTSRDGRASRSRMPRRPCRSRRIPTATRSGSCPHSRGSPSTADRPNSAGARVRPAQPEVSRSAGSQAPVRRLGT